MSQSSPNDRSCKRREAILEVARAVFAEEGYATASMSTIAARLGGSKGTLYNYFKNKEELFAECVRQECARFAEALFDSAPPDDLEAWLTAFGERFITHLLSDWAVRTYQLVISEAHRTPELARAFYEAGPAQWIQRLSAVLAAARDRGEMVADDCELAAQQFMSLCRGAHHFRYCLNLIERPSDAEIAHAVREAVATFMARYGAAEAAAAGRAA
jgi:AcrR family transcriptional regulator